MSKRHIFNLNGTKFELSKQVFFKLVECKNVALPEPDVTNSKGKEYFFERNAGCFEAILEYAQHGTLHMPATVCPNTFQRELEFWRVDARLMAPCCYRKYLAFFDDERTLKRFEQNIPLQEPKVKGQSSRGCRARTWALLDDPSSSVGAKVYLGVSTAFVLISLFVLAASTHPCFQRDLDENEWTLVLGKDGYNKHKDRLPVHGPPKPVQGQVQGQATGQVQGGGRTSPIPVSGTPPPDPTAKLDGEEKEDELDIDTASMHSRQIFLTYMEYATIAFFTLEAIFRIIFCPSKLRFFRNFLNIMDLVSLVAMYTTTTVENLLPEERYKSSVLDYVEILQILRIFRVFRIVKDVIGFRVLVYSLHSSVREIFLLLLYLSIGTVLFASVMYFLERENMRSIPDAAWWVVVTMTTVGYGDMSPISLQGKLLGCLCAICGVILIAVTVPIFVSNFLLFYTYSKAIEEIEGGEQEGSESVDEAWGRITRQDGVQFKTRMAEAKKGVNTVKPQETIILDDVKF
ncbi:potassium voltage-gated channel subfamily C member 4-like [Haliotis rufescens]|uniref:potassium voltage-gated channel subfamily C member 4-like n=1 Tax=Haliotis rufescens TaxID=6454 RepID=UPI00201F6159|nr:potassium voltage-gated channel subfamily C member 4-like [Haliotis rufescens]